MSKIKPQLPHWAAVSSSPKFAFSGAWQDGHGNWYSGFCLAPPLFFGATAASVSPSGISRSKMVPQLPHSAAVVPSSIRAFRGVAQDGQSKRRLGGFFLRLDLLRAGGDTGSGAATIISGSGSGAQASSSGSATGSSFGFFRKQCSSPLSNAMVVIGVLLADIEIAVMVPAPWSRCATRPPTTSFISSGGGDGGAGGAGMSRSKVVPQLPHSAAVVPSSMSAFRGVAQDGHAKRASGSFLTLLSAAGAAVAFSSGTSRSKIVSHWPH
mmetsp:Transcript_389/g.604  ORF Transcript_389/g.604 Transcript_389/m.604 type:complete len:267 (-) Transcript_389:762-1562(-)